MAVTGDDGGGLQGRVPWPSFIADPSVTTVTRRIEFHLLQPWHFS